jgi:hypothetical protein
LLATGCQTQPPPDAAIASVEITPAGVLLTAAGESRQLTAIARTADGTAVEAAVTWTSSDAEVASVDASGTVSATAAVGTATVTAEMGGVSSLPTYVTIAHPVAGAVLLTDAQIASAPNIVEPAGEPAPDLEYEVVLRDVTAAVPGAILINTEGLPVAGRVVSTAPEGNDLRVRLIVVPPGELFTAVEFKDTVDLGEGPFEIPADLAATYDIEQTGSAFVFTPKAATSGSAALASWTGSGGAPTRPRAQGAQGTVALPPLPPFNECEASEGFGSGLPVPLSVSSPPTFTFNATGSATREATAAGTKIVVQATPSFTFLAALEVKAAFEAKVECKLTLVTRTFRVPGWAGLFFGGDINFGVGFEIGGKVTLFAAKVGGTAEIKPTFEATLDCPAGSDCALSGDASALTKFEPVFVAPALNQAKFEPSVNLFGFISLEAGNADIEQLQFKAIEAKAGVELAASLTLEGLQIDDTAAEGRSKYGLAFKGEIGPGIKLGEFLTYLGLASVVPLKLGFEVPLGDSPTGTVKADKTRYLPGEEAVVTVTLAPASTVFPSGIGTYNVERVAVVRRDGLTTETLAEVDATAGKTTFELTFRSPGLVDATELYAFVVTKLLPLDPPRLEIGPATVPILFTFDSDLEGWGSFGVGPRSEDKEWGTVEWRDQAVRLSGVGGAGRRNSAISKSIALPADATSLTFKASADLGHDLADSNLTVKVVTDSGSTTLLTRDYSNTTDELLFTEESLDISAFAGLTVTIVFEQNDNGDGLHEHIYLDDIGIGTSPG